MLHATCGAYLTKHACCTPPANTASLTTFAQQSTDDTNTAPSNLCVLHGIEGSGKSTLLAQWISDLRSHLPNSSLIFEHHCRASTGAAQPAAVCRRLASILASQRTDDVTDAQLHTASTNYLMEGITALFRHLIGELSTMFAHVVLVLDDVEELLLSANSKTENGNLTLPVNSISGGESNSETETTATSRWVDEWMHDSLPPNVRIVLSTSDKSWAMNQTNNNDSSSSSSSLLFSMMERPHNKYHNMCTHMLRSSVHKTVTTVTTVTSESESESVQVLSEGDQQLLRAIMDTLQAKAKMEETTPRSIRRTVAVVRAVGIDIVDSELLSRLLSANSTFQVYDIVCSLWPLDSDDNTRLEKLVVPEVVFAAAILVACALTEGGGGTGNGLSPSDFVRILRHMLKGGETTQPVKINSKAVLRLVRALGFQDRVGGHVGGVRSDVSGNDVYRMKQTTLERYSVGLHERITHWHTQLPENERVVRQTSSIVDSTWLDVHACIGHYMTSKKEEVTLVRCRIACRHLWCGESWWQLSTLLSELGSFDLLWSSGWRSQRRIIQLWYHMVKYANISSDTTAVKGVSRLDPVLRYHESFTTAYMKAAEETTDTDQASAMDDSELGRIMYNVADMFMAMGALEKQMKLPEFVLPPIPRQHFEEWHEFVPDVNRMNGAARRKSRINRINTNKTGKKIGHKLYRRFVWSWFPLLAWNTPNEAQRYDREEQQRKSKSTANRGDQEHEDSVSIPPSITAERSVAEVMDGISRTPLSSLTQDKVRKTDAQVKAGARAESRMVDRAALSPRTRKSNQQAVSNGMLPSHTDALMEVRREMKEGIGRTRKEKVRGIRKYGGGVEAGGSSVLLSNIPENSIPVPSINIGIDAMVDQLFLIADDDGGGGGSSLSLPGLPPFPTPSPATTRTPMATPTSNDGMCLPSLTPTYQMSPMVARHVDLHLQGLPLTEKEGKMAENKAVVAELR